jgi:hypothetical protein
MPQKSINVGPRNMLTLILSKGSDCRTSISAPEINQGENLRNGVNTRLACYLRVKECYIITIKH